MGASWLRRAAVLPFLAVATGCGGGAFTSIANGGALVMPGHCADASIVDRGDGMKGMAARAPGCEQGTAYLVTESAAAIVWQIGSSPWAGPVLSNRVEVRVPVRELATGGDAKGLTSGSGAQGLASGGDAKGLATGEKAAGLASGGDAKGSAAPPLTSGGDGRTLVSGGDAKGLTTGGAGQGLASGGDAKGVVAGGANQGLASGGDAKGLGGSGEARARVLAGGGGDAPVVELRKEVSRDQIEPGETVDFGLVAKNVGKDAIRRCVIVDRLSAKLRVTESDAVATALPDGSTLLVWTLATPLAPGAEARVHVHAAAR